MERDTTPPSPGRSATSDEHGHLDEHAYLKADITELIRPYCGRTAKPPFSTCDPIMMAIVCSDKKHVSIVDVFKWIVRSFKHYTDKALDGFLEPTGEHFTEIYGSLEYFNSAFDEYD